MIAVATDTALHASHIMVFFSMILVGALFFTQYEESEKHKFGVSMACIVLGSIYVALPATSSVGLLLCILLPCMPWPLSFLPAGSPPGAPIGKNIIIAVQRKPRYLMNRDDQTHRQSNE